MAALGKGLLIGGIKQESKEDPGLKKMSTINKYIVCDRICLDDEKREYEIRKKKLDVKWNDMYYFQKLQEDIILTRINISKYNYALDEEVQDFG